MQETQYDPQLVDKLTRMLSEIPCFEVARHLGRPFLTSHQIAISFKHRHPQEYERLGLKIGGAEIDQHETSLARYIAHQLSQAIKNGHTHIEGAVLSYQHLEDMTLDNDGEVIRPSRFPVTMFRYVESKVGSG
jgi:hypothetical protein